MRLPSAAAVALLLTALLFGAAALFLAFNGLGYPKSTAADVLVAAAILLVALTAGLLWGGDGYAD